MYSLDAHPFPPRFLGGSVPGLVVIATVLPCCRLQVPFAGVLNAGAALVV